VGVLEGNDQARGIVAERAEGVGQPEPGDVLRIETIST
jgi:hypothetical protein